MPVLPQPSVASAMPGQCLKPLPRRVLVAPRARFLHRKVPRLALRAGLGPTQRAPLRATTARPTRFATAMDARHAQIVLLEKPQRKEPAPASTGVRRGPPVTVILVRALPTPTQRHALESTGLSLVAVVGKEKSRSRFPELERITLARAPSICREGSLTSSFRTTPMGTAGMVTRPT